MSSLRPQVILLKKIYMCLIKPTIVSSLAPCTLQFTLAGRNILSPLYVWGTLLYPLISAQVSFFFFLVKSYCTCSAQNQSLFFPIPCHCNCIFRSVRVGGPSHLLSHSSPQVICWLDQNDLEDRNRLFIVINNKAHRTRVKKYSGIQQT